MSIRDIFDDVRQCTEDAWQHHLPQESKERNSPFEYLSRALTNPDPPKMVLVDYPIMHRVTQELLIKEHRVKLEQRDAKGYDHGW